MSAKVQDDDAAAGAIEDAELDAIVKDEMNSLTDADKAQMKQVVSALRADIHGAVQENDELDFAFWVQILSAGIMLVEHFVLGEGNKKKEFVIELVALVLQHELPGDDESKERTIKIFRKIAPSAINTIVFVSKQINVENLKRCCFCCFTKKVSTGVQK